MNNKSDQERSCSFCMKSKDVGKLVAGPSKHGRGVNICSKCVTACANLASSSELLKTDSEVVSCDFCERPLRKIIYNGDVLLSRNSFSICGNCLGLTLQINIRDRQPENESAILF